MKKNAKTKRPEAFAISMPLFIEMGKIKPKKFYINLNNYRNWHYQVNNNLKSRYKEILSDKVEGMSFGRISLVFTLHRGDRRRVDRSNILSIHEKFFCDAIVECGCIKDDSDDFLVSTHYFTGNVDRDNPRVDILINTTE